MMSELERLKESERALKAALVKSNRERIQVRTELDATRQAGISAAVRADEQIQTLNKMKDKMYDFSISLTNYITDPVEQQKAKKKLNELKGITIK